MTRTYLLKTTKYFEKKYLKLISKNKEIDKKTRAVFKRLSQDPKDSSLESHKVESARFGKLYSSKVTQDIRILWDYSKKEIQVLDIYDIGGHSGKKKVYS